MPTGIHPNYEERGVSSMLEAQLLKDVATSECRLPAAQLEYIHERALASKKFSILADLLRRDDLPPSLRETILQSKSATVIAALAGTAEPGSEPVKAALKDKRVSIANAVASRLDLTQEDYLTIAKQSPLQALPTLVANPAAWYPARLLACERLAARRPGGKFSPHDLYLAVELDERLLVVVAPALVEMFGKFEHIVHLPMSEKQLSTLAHALLDEVKLSLEEKRAYGWRVQEYAKNLALLLGRADLPDECRALYEDRVAEGACVTAAKVRVGSTKVQTDLKYCNWVEGQPITDKQVSAFVKTNPTVQNVVRRVLSHPVTLQQMAVLLLCSKQSYRGWRAGNTSYELRRDALKVFDQFAGNPTTAALVLLAFPFLLNSDEFKSLRSKDAVIKATLPLLDNAFAGSMPFATADVLAVESDDLNLRLPAAQVMRMVRESSGTRMRQLLFAMLWDAFGADHAKWLSFEALASTIKDRSVVDIINAASDSVD